MARRAAKELLHVLEWLGRVDEITRDGKHASVPRTATRNVSQLAYNTYATKVCSTVGGGKWAFTQTSSPGNLPI